MHHAYQHAAEVVEQVGRRVQDAQRLEQLVHHAIAAQQHDPGEGAHQEAGPERQQHPEQERGLAPGRQAGDQVGHGIAGHHGEERRPQRDLQRNQQHVHIHGRFEQPVVLRQREALVAEHAQQQQLPHGIDEQHQQQHDQGRRHQEVAAPRAHALAGSGKGRHALTPGWRPRRRPAS
ncbi:hypothetical protein D9M68_777260 [compost metagenome]